MARPVIFVFVIIAVVFYGIIYDILGGNKK